MSEKELALDARDRLSALSEAFLEDGVEMGFEESQEAHVVACCIAVAVEELEKYLYEGNWTPSVRPYREGEEWNWPGEDDKSMSGPPHKRQSRPVEEKFPVLEKLKRKGPIPKVVKIPLKGHHPALWSPLESETFRDGDWQGFCRAVRISTQAPLKDVVGYAKRAKQDYPDIWGINKK